MFMQRAAWTDERLDDLSSRMDVGFDRVDRDIRDLRHEMGQRFDRLETTVTRFGGGLLAALVLAILLRGL